MPPLSRAIAIALASLALLLVPTETDLLAPRTAHAASGATSPVPPNHFFESGPKSVGNGPTNYDFSSGGSGWTTSFGNVTYSGGTATLSGGTQIKSSTYALDSTTQAVKVRYKYPAAASASVSIFVGGTSYGSSNLSCPVGCNTGDWVEKYIGNYTAAQGQTVNVRITQSSGTTEVDEVGTQWIPLQEWHGSTTGIGSQPKFDADQFAQVHGQLYSADFTLIENRFEFDYSFPLPTGNSLIAYLYRASDDLILSTKTLSGNGVGWTRATWTWGQDYTGQTVYLRFNASQASWIDGVGIGAMAVLSANSQPSAKAGDPFDTSTAQSLHSHTDIAIPGKGVPLEFTRFYGSLDATAGDLGYNWRHNYSTSLRIDSDQSVMVTYGSGGGAFFKYNAGSYTAPAGVHDTLVKNGDNTYTLTTEGQIRYSFDTAGKLATIKDRNNNTTTLNYSGGLLTSVSDPGGRSLTFSYDGSNRIYRVTDPLQSPNTRTVEFTYDTNGDLWKVKDVKADPTNGPFTIYTYSNHRMLTLTDSNSHLQNTNIYDGANRVVEQTDAMGGKFCSYYGTPPAYTSTACPGVNPAPAAGQTVVVDPRGKKTTYDFDVKFRTTSITDHDGGVTSFGYDSSNNRTSVTDPRSKVTSYTYDSKGSVLTETNPLRQPSGAPESGSQCGTLGTGNQTDDDADTKVDDGCPSGKYEYTANNDLDLETDALGRQTDYIYDSSGNLTRTARKNSSGTVKALTCFERDSSGQVTATVQSTNLTIPSGATDPCTGNKTLMGYDTYGNVTCTVNARFTGSTTCASDPGKKATFIYDLGGRLLYSTNEITNNSKPVKGSAPEIGSQCGTDGNGNGVNDDSSDDTTTDDGCASAQYIYDAQNNVLTVTDGLGNTSWNTYDSKGNLVGVRDANRKAAGSGPESGSQCGPYGTGNGLADNPADDLVVDDGCLSVTYIYDLGDRLEKVVQAAVSTTSVPTTTYGYDANGNRISVTNPKRQVVGTAESGSQCGTAGTGNDTDEDSDTVKDDGCPSTKHAYDNLDRLQSSTDALARVTSYQHDAASNLTQRTDARSLITKYIPDDANRLDQIEHRLADNTLVDTVDYMYNAVGFRTQMVDPTGTTSYTPDDFDRISSVTFPGPKTVSYTYDDAAGGSAADYPGQRTKITYPDSKTVDYTYLADGRMSTVTDWLTKQTSYTYDDGGRLTKTQLPNGVYAHNRYDAADGLTCVVNDKTSSAPSSCTSGTVVSKFDYTLDAIGNRTQMVDLAGTHTYQYDALYELTQATYPGPQNDTYTYDANGNRITKNAGSYSYDAADQMTTAGGVTHGYDNNGNQTSRGSDTFAYDHENRLTQSVISGSTSSSIYNGDVLRMSHTANAVTTAYDWDIASGLPVILQERLGLPPPLDLVQATYVYGLDLISSTDATGSQTYFLYDGSGSTTGLTDGSGNNPVSYSYDVFGAIRSQTGTSTNTWLFAGEQRDNDSILYYLRARYYDPAIGRFLSQDPIPKGNLYTYVGNDPVNYLDPKGTCRIEVRARRLLGVPLVNAYHLYIHTYDPTDESEVGFRGTNDGLLPDPHGLTSDLYAYRFDYAPGFKDYDADDDDPRVEIHNDDGSCGRFRKSFKESAREINSANLAYHAIRGPNSKRDRVPFIDRTVT